MSHACLLAAGCWLLAAAGTTACGFLATAPLLLAAETVLVCWLHGCRFFLPNCTFGQPPYFVNQMIAQSYHPRGLEITTSFSSSSTGTTTAADSVDCFAAANELGSVVVLRCVNYQPLPVRLSATLLPSSSGGGGGLASGGADSAAVGWKWSARTMAGASPRMNNTPAQPRLVAPVKVATRAARAVAGRNGGAASLTLPAFSFTVVTWQRHV